VSAVLCNLRVLTYSCCVGPETHQHHWHLRRAEIQLIVGRYARIKVLLEYLGLGHSLNLLLPHSAKYSRTQKIVRAFTVLLICYRGCILTLIKVLYEASAYASRT
jgi:hypothetical protein